MTTAHIIHQVHPLDLASDLIRFANQLLTDAGLPQQFITNFTDTHLHLTLQPTTPMTVITVPKIDVAHEIEVNKSLRRDIDARIQELKSATPSRERSLAITKLQEAVMWLGMDLKRIGEENPGYVANPYPNSKDPGNTVIDRTADGLKL